MNNERRQWLIDYRKKSGLSQRNVAKLSGISHQYYCFIEYGQRGLKPDKAKRIAKVLKFKWTKFYD